MRVKILDKKRVFDDLFKMDEIFLQYQKFSGEMSSTVRRLNFERGASVGVFLKLTDCDEYVLVNQFRYALHERRENGWTDEIIAGTFTNEEPEECACRETIEETGYKLTGLKPMRTFFASPGGTTEKIYLYMGYSRQDLKVSDGGGLESENEDIRLKNFTEQELKTRVLNSQIRDAKTIIAIQQYFLFRDQYESF